MKLQQLCVELNTFYTIENLLKSDIVKDAVKNKGLELHASVLNEATGEVELLGEHPILGELLKDKKVVQ